MLLVWGPQRTTRDGGESGPVFSRGKPDGTVQMVWLWEQLLGELRGFVSQSVLYLSRSLAPDTQPAHKKIFEAIVIFWWPQTFSVWSLPNSNVEAMAYQKIFMPLPALEKQSRKMLFLCLKCWDTQDVSMSYKDTEQNIRTQILSGNFRLCN